MRTKGALLVVGSLLPRNATCGALVRLRIDMEERGGNVEGAKAGIIKGDD